ncbi:MAG: hypothetical protein RL095_334 [Verrucomicrobiota bacterium]|jgi:DNA-binding beta-propeller fold protein YncE
MIASLFAALYLSFSPKNPADSNPEKKDPIEVIKSLSASPNSIPLYSPDGKYFILGGSTLQIFDAKSREILDVWGIGSDKIKALNLTPSGKILVIEFEIPEKNKEYYHLANHEIAVYSFPEGKQINRFKSVSRSSQKKSRLAISPDGTKVATESKNKITVFGIVDGKIQKEFVDKSESPGISDCAFDATPDWKYFFLNKSRVAYSSEEVVNKIKIDDSMFGSQFISPDGKLAFVSDGRYSKKSIYNIDTGELIKECPTNFEERNAVVDWVNQRVIFNRYYWDFNKNIICALSATLAADGGLPAISPDHSEISQSEKWEKISSFKEKPGADLEYKDWVNVFKLQKPDFLVFDNLESTLPSQKLDLKTKKFIPIKSDDSYAGRLVKNFGEGCEGVKTSKNMSFFYFMGELYFPGSTKKGKIKLYEDESFTMTGEGLMTDKICAIVLQKNSPDFVRVMEIPSKKIICEIPHSFSSSIITGSDKWIAINDNSRNHTSIFHFHSLPGGKKIHEMVASPTGIARFIDNDRVIVTHGNMADVISTKTWKPISSFAVKYGHIASCTVSNNGKLVLVTTDANNYVLLDGATCRPINILYMSKGEPYLAPFSKPSR